MEKEVFESIKKQRDILSNGEKIKAFILQKCTLNYEKYSLINKTRAEYEAFLNIKDFATYIDLVKPFVKRFKPDRENSFNEQLVNREQLIAMTKEVDLTINEIIRMRNSIKAEIEKDGNNIIGDDTCPYCGIEWETAEKLLINFEKREETLRNLSSDQAKRLSEYEIDLEENYVKPIVQQMNGYLEENTKIDPKIINLLKTFKDKTFNFTELDRYEFNKNTIWTQPLKYEDLIDQVTEIKNIIEDKIPVSGKTFNKMESLSNTLLDSSIAELEGIVSKDDLAKYIVKEFNKTLTTTGHKLKVKELISFLDMEKQKYKYDHAKVQDDDEIYDRYFSSKKEELQSLNLEKITAKKQYIKYLFSKKQSDQLDKYQSRNEKLNEIITKIEKTRRSYNGLLKSHKSKMANNIKLPFYIYTAKILQNYQQGMGVFLSTSEDKDAIRFLTDISTDHDATHHLSSGQLAVVSLAFTLAINKTYNISDNLKFLAIDDPIQEMDALNIHSFIELIRHEFLEEYQMVFSTHSDTNALYMKYKFEKMTNRPVSMINVQKEFF